MDDPEATYSCKLAYNIFYSGDSPGWVDSRVVVLPKRGS